MELVSAIKTLLCSVGSCNHHLLFCIYAVSVSRILDTHPRMLTDDMGPLLWDTAQLAPAVLHGKLSSIKLLALVCSPQAARSFIPVSGSCRTRRLGRSELISEQIILPRGGYYDSQNQLTAVEFWLTRFSGGRLVAWMDFKRWCGTISFVKGTHLNEDKVIQLQQVSLALCFSLDCPCWIQVSHMFHG